MKKLIFTLLIAAPLLTISFASKAHDPKMHMKKAEKANCGALVKMKNGNEKMDMSDPIMIAMMKKCEKQLKAEMKDHEEMVSESPASKDMKHEKMKHDEIKEKKGVKKHKDDEHNH